MRSKSFCVVLLIGVALLLHMFGGFHYAFENHEPCGPSRADLQRPFPMLITVYDSTDDDMEGGSVTCTGKRLRKGMAAADLTIFPLGTVLEIVELGWNVIVSDCGGGVKGNHVDVFVSGSHDNKGLQRKESLMVRMTRKEYGNGRF